MKYLKRFNESINNESELLDYISSNFPKEWFDEQLTDRVVDYVGEEEAEDFEGDYEEAYKNLCNGGAVEYDMMEDMAKDLQSHFNITSEEYYNNKIDNRTASEIVNDYLMDTCDWHDKFVFNKSGGENYTSMSDKLFGKSNLNLNWDDKFGDEKNPLP